MAWNQLISIYQTNRDEVASGRDIERYTCPNDGEPLKQGPHGEFYCPYDGYRPDGPGNIGR